MFFWSFAFYSLKAQSEVAIHQVGYGYYNAFLLSENENHILVDCAEEGKADKVVKNIKRLGVDLSEIDLMIITHVHGDHVGNAAFFQQKYGMKVMIHENEVNIAKIGQIAPLKIGSPKTKLSEFVKKRAHYYFPAFTPDIVMSQDTIDLMPYGVRGKVFLVGGHTIGSIAISLGPSIIIGDLLRGQLLRRKKPAYHFFANDPEGLVEVINQIIAAGYETYYVGHGDPLEREDVVRFLDKKPLLDALEE